MQSIADLPSSRRDLTPWAKAAFLVALALTIALIVLGVTGTPWPRWLLALTNIL